MVMFLVVTLVAIIDFGFGGKFGLIELLKWTV